MTQRTRREKSANKEFCLLLMFATNFVYCVSVAYYPSPPVFSAVGIPGMPGVRQILRTYVPTYMENEKNLENKEFRLLLHDVCTLQTLFIASVAYPSHK